MDSCSDGNEMVENYIKEITDLSGRYSTWEVWNDFISICAISLSNSCDKEQAPQREEEYLRIVKKYKPDELQVFCKLFAQLVMDLEEDPDQDILGETYSRLRIVSKAHGQYFTPYNLSKAMAKMIMGEMDDGPHLINEPTCGSGSNLIAAANTMKEEGINYQHNAYFVAQDIDSVVAKMCYIQMSLLGMPGVVIVGNTLLGITDDMERWYTPFHFLFGDMILRRYKNKMDMKKETGAAQEKKEKQQENWLLELVGLT